MLCNGKTLILLKENFTFTRPSIELSVTLMNSGKNWIVQSQVSKSPPQKEQQAIELYL